MQVTNHDTLSINHNVKELKPVHTKEDNYDHNDNVLKIIVKL